MFAVTRSVPQFCHCIAATSKVVSRTFAVDAESYHQRMKEFEKNRREYNAAVKNLRKQYAAEYQDLQKQYSDIREKKVKANEEAMKALAEKRKQEKKNNLRHHYEHLCATQMEKSVRRVGAIHNQLKREAIRERNVRHMLTEHMGYVYDAYKPEEVETRVLKEMKEVVPFDRVYMAPPSGVVKDSDYLSYEDYEHVYNIRMDWAAYRAHNKELHEKWKQQK